MRRCGCCALTGASDCCCRCRRPQVCDGKAEAAAELGRCLGHELVPAEYGGPCSLAYEEYPAQQQLLRHVAKLRAAGADAALAAS